MAAYTIFRAAFGYLFLILIVRIAGRRPGKQLAPFEFVLVFYLGGLTLTGMVGNEVSLTNAICQILTIAVCHYALSGLRYRFPSLALILDGLPLTLQTQNALQNETLQHMRIHEDDIMDMARDQGLSDLCAVETAVLETSGEISICPRKEDS